MPIADTDLLIKYSTKTGSAGNTTSSNGVSSLGKYVSTTVITSGVLQNLFPTLTGDENNTSAVNYLCVFVHNSHSTLTLIGPKAWLTNKTAAATLIDIGVDTTVASIISASAAQALSVATITTAPGGVTFSAPISKSAGISLGDIGPGQCKAIWVRRTAQNTGALAVDSVVLRIQGDTAA